MLAIKLLGFEDVTSCSSLGDFDTAEVSVELSIAATAAAVVVLVVVVVVFAVVLINGIIFDHICVVSSVYFMEPAELSLAGGDDGVFNVVVTVNGVDDEGIGEVVASFPDVVIGFFDVFSLGVEPAVVVVGVVVEVPGRLPFTSSLIKRNSSARSISLVAAIDADVEDVVAVVVIAAVDANVSATAVVSVSVAVSVDDKAFGVSVVVLTSLPDTTSAALSRSCLAKC